ncbi:MAG: GerMN domain-containing protein [Clostridia bacterium]|nr:GerMN domain-containing protein [Clostridia bacterium]
MKKGMKKFAALIMALCFGLSVCGCMGKVIAEDKTKLDLPQIDPDDGASRERVVTLYYRLANEKYLAGVEGKVTVRNGERTEAAVIRALMEGSALSPGVTMLIPSAVSLKEVSFEEGVLYVTLSEEFLNDDMVTSVKEGDYLKEKDYNDAVKAATEEMYLVRRLGVQSIVNTITGNNGDVKVQILIERGGKGRQISLGELGYEGMDKVFVDPMGYDEDLVANEQSIAACMLEHMVNTDYERAYALITEGYDAYKPAYDEFAAQISELGSVLSYEVTEGGSNANGTYVMVNVRLASADGTVKRVSNAMLYMAKENNIYKVSYSSLKKLMES